MFNNQASALVVTELLAEGYMNASEAIATTAVQNVNTLVGCDPATQTPAVCGAKFIDSFGKRAFRRPLDADGKACSRTSSSRRSSVGLPTAIRLVIETALQSPRFLSARVRHARSGSGADVAKLDDYEVASRLSYLLWGSMPDDELLRRRRRAP